MVWPENKSKQLGKNILILYQVQDCSAWHVAQRGFFLFLLKFYVQKVLSSDWTGVVICIYTFFKF